MPFCWGVPLTLKVLRKKEYSEIPETLGQHLKKRRKELGLLQREVAKQMGIAVETLINWEKGRTAPVPAQFKPVVGFLGDDPSPSPSTLAERVQARRRALGITFDQLAQHLGWDVGTLTRYLNGTWRMPVARGDLLEAFLTAQPFQLAKRLQTVPRRVSHRIRSKAIPAS